MFLVKKNGALSGRRKGDDCMRDYGQAAPAMLVRRWIGKLTLP